VLGFVLPPPLLPAPEPELPALPGWSVPEFIAELGEEFVALPLLLLVVSPAAPPTEFGEAAEDDPDAEFVVSPG
jgi:hypothetical protein